MKNRKVGLRMCIISIIMITLCIPNQIQIANAAREENEASIKVVDEYQNEWGTDTETGDSDTELSVFPKDSRDNITKINPGGSGEYKFTVTNHASFHITYKLTILEKVNQFNYPIEYMLTDGVGRTLKEWQKLDTELAYSARLNKGKDEELVLKWRFIDMGEDVTEGIYKIRLNVIATEVTDSDDNNKPVNPDDDKKDDNNKGDNNNSNNSGNNTNNGRDDSKGNDSSNNNQGNNQNNSNNLNIDKTSNKGTGSTETNKKKVNTSDITTPVIYVALMILMFGLILLVKSRKEN